MICTFVAPGCGGKSKGESAPPPATTPSAAPADSAPAANAAAPKPAATASCVAWSATEHPNAPKEGVCEGEAVSIEQGDCGHYVNIKNDAGQEAVFICWEPCEVLQSDSPPVWKGKRLKVRWKIGKLAVAGHDQCNNDAAPLVSGIEVAP
jgi:hypothetical protein